jgi:2-isopropylmalate synthase
VHERHPYAGELVYTAFSGSHQDAIKKGFDALTKRNDPHLPSALPADRPEGRRARLRGGDPHQLASRVRAASPTCCRQDHGLDLPRPLQIEFSKIAQEKMDEDGKELTSSALWALFQGTYLLTDAPLTLVSHKTYPTAVGSRTLTADIRLQDGSIQTIEGEGNGPIDAFVDALQRTYGVTFSFLDYQEHAVGRGANATAACYVKLEDQAGRTLHGVGIDPNIVMASLKAVLSGVQRIMAASRA